MTDSLPARVARLESAVRMLAVCCDLPDVDNEQQVERVLSGERDYAPPPDTTREATLREALKEREGMCDFVLPCEDERSMGYAEGLEQGALSACDRVKAMLTAPAPQPPEPVESRNRDAEINRLRAREAEMVAGFESIIDMIDNCADVPRNPDSLPMMVLQHARATLAGGYDALTAARQEPS